MRRRTWLCNVGWLRCNCGIYLIIFVSLFVCLSCLSVRLSGCLPACLSDIYPSIYGRDDQNSLTYLLILKWRGVNPAFVFLSLWKLLHLVCPSDPSTISIHVATLRTAACGYLQEVRETRSAVWNVDGWGQKRKPIHTRQTIRSPARPASCWEMGGPSRDTFARLDSETNKAQCLKWPCNDFAMALRLVYYLFKHIIFYHLPQGNDSRWRYGSWHDVWCLKVPEVLQLTHLTYGWVLGSWGKNKARDIGILVMWDDIDTWKVQNHAT